METKRKVLAVLLAVGMLWDVSSQVRAQGAQNAKQLAQLKRDCLSVVRVGNLEDALTNAGGFVGTFMPTMNAETLPGVVGAQLFKNPQLTGIKADDAQCLFVLNPKRYWDVAVVLSISDKEAYTNALGQTLKDLGAAGDIHVFGESEFAPNPNVLYYVSFSGSYAVFSKDQHACSAVKRWLDEGIIDPTAAPNVEGDITARLNIKRLIEIYGPEIERAVNMVRKQMEMGMPGGPPGFDAAKMLQIEINLARSLAGQLDSLEAGAEFKPEGLRLRESLSFTQGSRIGEFLASQTPVEPTLLKIIPEDCIGVFSLAATGPTDEIGALYAKLLEALAVEAETQEKLLDYLAQGLEILGDEFAFAMLSSSDGTGGIEMVEVFTLKDTAKAKELLLKVVGDESLSVWYKNFGMSKPQLEEATQTYRGVEVQTMTMEIPFTEGQPPQVAAMMRTMYGDRIEMKIAFHENKALVTFGKNADTRMQQVIDLMNGEGTSMADSPVFKSATVGLSTEGCIAYLSVPRLIEWIRHIVPIPLGEVTANVTSGIGMQVGLEGSTLKAEQYVPTAEILNIMGVIGQLTRKPAQRPGAAQQQGAGQQQ